MAPDDDDDLGGGVGDVQMDEPETECDDDQQPADDGESPFSAQSRCTAIMVVGAFGFGFRTAGSVRWIDQ